MTVALATPILLGTSPTVMTAGLLALTAMPLLVLGETVEDQLGRGRYLALCAVATGLGSWLGGVPVAAFAAITAGVAGTHIALFPTARILLTLGVALVEVPSFFLVGCWVLTLLIARVPLTGAACALMLAAATARFVRPRDHARWDHFDTAR